MAQSLERKADTGGIRMDRNLQPTRLPHSHLPPWGWQWWAAQAGWNGRRTRKERDWMLLQLPRPLLGKRSPQHWLEVLKWLAPLLLLLLLTLMELLWNIRQKHTSVNKNFNLIIKEIYKVPTMWLNPFIAVMSFENDQQQCKIRKLQAFLSPFVHWHEKRL